jgi:N utilization substance protein B
VAGTWQNVERIDALLGSCADNWSVERMSRVDRSILRMAVYELLHCHDIPPKVAINEAIDLGKLFGSENSGAFINGVLDALYAKLRADTNITK